MDRFLDRRFVARVQAGFLDIGRRVIAVMAREALLNLRAAAVAMHVAKAAYVHQDVKLKLLAGVEAAQKLIMPATIAQSQIDNFAALLCRERLHPLCDLPVRIMARGI